MCINERVIVSLTSYPPRISMVSNTIKSLCNQTMKPNKILLWLSADEFANTYMDVPKGLLEMIGSNGFEIRWVEGNLMPHKKYYYALQEFKDDVVITVDDDVYYQNDLVEKLFEAHKQFPQAIITRRARKMLRKDGQFSEYVFFKGFDIEEGCERYDTLAIGIGGILYPPRCATDLWFDRKLICDTSLKQDDLWLKYNEVIGGIPIVNIGGFEEKSYIEASETALFKENVIQNDIALVKLSELLNMKYPNIWNNWFEKLGDLDSEVKSVEIELKRNLTEILEDNNYNKTYIYGAGKISKALYEFICSVDLDSCIDGFIVTDEEKINQGNIFGKKISTVTQIKEQESVLVICGVGETIKREIRSHVLLMGNVTWYEPDCEKIKWLNRVNTNK